MIQAQTFSHAMAKLSHFYHVLQFSMATCLVGGALWGGGNADHGAYAVRSSRRGLPLLRFCAAPYVYSSTLFGSKTFTLLQLYASVCI